VVEDKTRCDIVTATHAIEVDFADKWAEAQKLSREMVEASPNLLRDY
jgi:hypothetical protein